MGWEDTWMNSEKGLCSLCDNAWSSIWGIRAISISSRLLFNTGNKGINTTKVKLGNLYAAINSQLAREMATPNACTDEFLMLGCVKGAWGPEVLKLPFYQWLPKLSPRHPPPHFIPSPSQFYLPQAQAHLSQFPSRFAKSGKSYACTKFLAILHGWLKLWGWECSWGLSKAGTLLWIRFLNLGTWLS